jgi:hypothetical protein
MPISEHAARQNLKAILDAYSNLTPDQRREMTEASVVRQFIDRLLEEVLGWPIKDPTRYQYEMRLEEGRPDLTLFPENGGVIYVEAKKFGIIKDLKQASSTLSTKTLRPNEMPQPGMTVDRTPEEQQAINYAFNSGGTWAILTNFEKLRLFNARRDWLVFSFDDPYDYQHDFDLLWQLAYPNVLKGSLDNLSNLRYARDIDHAYLEFVNEWRLRLAQDIIKGQDKNPWLFQADGSIDLAALRAVVQRYLDRLVIARFAEDWLVVPPGTLRQFAEMRRGSLYTHSMDQFLDTFFRRFDQEHNSALFAKGLADEAVFSDDALLPLIDKLYEVRYRAMPADILGNTYEQYLGKILVLDNGSVTTRDNLETRKKQGSYYTPQVIVKYIVDNSLGRYLYGTADGKPDGEPVAGETRKTSRDIRDLRCLDSACGSGSFLIYAYRVLADFYEGEITRLRAELEERIQRLAADFTEMTTDDRIENQRLENEITWISDYRRLILETHLYGVDLDPQAAEIATVNLIMRAMEGRHKEKLLPLILNQNVKVGNGLVGKTLISHNDREGEQETFREAVAELCVLRADLTQAPSGEQHANAIALLETKTRALADRLNADITPHFSDLERVRPFHWGIEFPEVFYNADGTPKEDGGFQIIFGNPPWEILKPDLREFYAQFDERIESRFNRAQVEIRIAELEAEDPQRRTLFEEQTAITETTAAYVRQSEEYTRQGGGDTATHKLFLERMYGLLQNGGRLGYVVPSGIYTDLGTKPLREMLLNEGNIQYIYSFSNERGFFNGVHHDFKFALLGTQKGIQSDGFLASFRFNPRIAVRPDDLPTFLGNPENLIFVRRDSIKRFSPDELILMEFQSNLDYEIAEKIYSHWPLLGSEIEGAWNPKFTAEFHITNDRNLFNEEGRGLPLYEGKMLHQYDAFYAEPTYWLEEEAARNRLSVRYGLQVNELDYLKSRLAYRGISNATNERTLIVTILPPRVFCEGRSATTVIQQDITLAQQLFMAGCMNSFILDWTLRQKVAKNVNMFHIYSLPIPRLMEGSPYFEAIVPRAARLTCTRVEFTGLWEAVMGEGWDASTSAVDSVQRQTLRDEIDALVAHLYSLSRDEYDHILGTFPLVFPDNGVGQARRAATLAAFDNVEL